MKVRFDGNIFIFSLNLYISSCYKYNHADMLQWPHTFFCLFTVNINVVSPTMI